MRSISRELELPIDAEATFRLLHTPSAIRGWWSASRAVVVARRGGLWVATWGPLEDASPWDPPHRLRLGQFEYFTRDGAPPSFTAALETEFFVQSRDGGSVLRVQQTGFPMDQEADAFFVACKQGWAATLQGIVRYVAEGSLTCE